MRELNDPDFGIIHFNDDKYDNFWTLERRVNFNGHHIPIRIDPENPKTLAISEVQRQAVKLALNLPADSLWISAPAVIQNYECYQEDLEETELLELSDPANIWNGVEPSYISVPAHSDSPYIRCQNTYIHSLCRIYLG